MSVLENSSFQKMLNALDDIQYLEPHLGTQVSHIQSYMFDISSDLPRNSLTSDYSKKRVKFLLREKIQELILNQSLDLGLQNVNFSIDDELEVETLCKIEKEISFFFKALKVFTVSGALRITVGETRVCLTFHALDIEDDQSSKGFIKNLTRELFTHKTLFTFEMLDINNGQGQSIALQFDLGADSNSLKGHLVKPDVNITIPGYMAEYEVKQAQNLPLGRHLVLIVTGELNLKLESSIPKKLVSSSVKKTAFHDSSIYHFPFLFRPISIIIPNVDLQSRSSQLGPATKKNTGSVMAEKSSTGHIDFFNFF